MPGLILWKNQHINRLKRDIDSMFDRVWDEFGLASRQGIIRRSPSLEFSETIESFILTATLPDVDPDDLELSLTGDLLAIKGKIPHDIIEEGVNFYKTHRILDSFTRTIKLPCRIEADRIVAAYENGILKIVIPKSPPEETKIIKIAKKTR
jgi:HSP20 family protein